MTQDKMYDKPKIPNRMVAISFEAYHSMLKLITRDMSPENCPTLKSCLEEAIKEWVEKREKS